MMTVLAALPDGILLPESILQTDWFKVLATFVAINTVMYATLAILKMLPKGYALSWFSGRNRRRRNRSIYPEPTATQRRLWDAWAGRLRRSTAAQLSTSGDVAPAAGMGPDGPATKNLGHDKDTRPADREAP